MFQDFAKFKITYTLIALNSLAYLVSMLYTGEIVNMPAQKLVELGGIFGPLVVLQGEWWRVVTAIFLHGGMTHVLMNMFSLYVVGRAVEFYFRPIEYLVIYFVSGILGALASIYFHPLIVSIGASGAIFGIFGALAGYFLAFRKELGERLKPFIKDFGIIIGINIFIGFSIPNIDISAHAAGLFAGILGGFLIGKNPRFLWLFLLFGLIALLFAYNYLPSVVCGTQGIICR